MHQPRLDTRRKRTRLLFSPVTKAELLLAAVCGLVLVSASPSDRLSHCASDSAGARWCARSNKGSAGEFRGHVVCGRGPCVRTGSGAVRCARRPDQEIALDDGFSRCWKKNGKNRETSCVRALRANCARTR